MEYTTQDPAEKEKQFQCPAHWRVTQPRLALCTHAVPCDPLSHLELIPERQGGEVPSGGTAVQSPAPGRVNTEIKPSSGFCHIESWEHPRTSAQLLLGLSLASLTPQSKFIPLTKSLPFKSQESCSLLLYASQARP